MGEGVFPNTEMLSIGVLNLFTLSILCLVTFFVLPYIINSVNIIKTTSLNVMKEKLKVQN